MAGYLGTKAVLLSTTAADVVGNAEIGGDLTVGGAFTSQGIDDNASATAMTLDASGNVGIGGASTFTSGTNIEVMDANVARLGFTNTSTNGSQWAWFAGTSGQAALYDYDNSRQAMTIDSSGRVTMPYQPAFRVAGNSSTNWVAIYDELIFPLQDFNNGNHFNLTSGRFTAPVSGYYVFSAHLVATGAAIGTIGELYLIKNDSTAARYFLDRQYKSGGTSSNSYSLGGSAVIYLSANDFVGVAAHSLSTSVVIEGSSSFSGYLLG